MSVSPYLDHHLLGKRVHYRRAYSVESAGYLISAAAELSAGVQLGVDYLHAGHPVLGVDVDRHSAAVVFDRYGIIGVYRNFDVFAESRERFVHAVVHDFVDQMVKPARPCRSYIHSGALADRFQAFEDLDLRGVILARYL